MIESDLERIEVEIAGGTAETFTWKGAAVKCTPTSVRRGQLIEQGGNLYEVELTLFVRRSNFITVDSTLITVDSDIYTVDSDLPTPVAGRTLVFRGRTYRIITARESGPRSHFELSLADYGSNR